MTQPTDRILPGVALMIGFCAVAPMIDISGKLASQAVSIGQITTARFLVQAALMVPVLLLMRQSFGINGAALVLVVLRAVTSILATFCFVGAVAVMPLADALAIAFVEPLVILLLGAWLFRDVVGPRRIAAATVGFGGSLLVIQPSLAAFGSVALLPLGTAVFFALYMLLTRALSRRMHPVAMQVHTAWIATALCIPFLVAGAALDIAAIRPTWPEPRIWLYLFGVGVAATVSHMMMTYALKLAPASTLAPLHYLEIVSAVALGYAIFGDFPDATTWAGIAVITGSGLYVIHRERVTARVRARPAPPPGPAAAA
jgi:drug/metabolite transporter (DMT)-like permease